MKTLYTFGAERVERNLTVADILAAKGSRVLTETTATSAEAAAAASDAEVDMLVGPAVLQAAMREGAPHVFTTIGVKVTAFASADAVLGEAYRVMEAGADAVYCPREPRIVEHLAAASIPVMSHVGLVPRVSTWIGGLRAFGRTADEALELYQTIKDLENAGAVMAEVEVVAADALSAIAPLTKMSLISLGSGPGGDVQYLFQEDAIGETPNPPRHARAFGDIKPHVAAIAEERRRALRAFRDATQSGSYPAAQESVRMKEGEKDRFHNALAKASKQV